MHRFFRAVTVTALAMGAADMSLATDLAAAQAPAATTKRVVAGASAGWPAGCTG